MLLIAVSRVAPRAAVTIVYPIGGSCPRGLSVHCGQRSAPAGEFTGHGDIGHHRSFLAGSEGLPALVQPVIARVSSGASSGWGVVPPGSHDRAGVAVGLAVMPGGLDQQPTRMSAAGLGDRALAGHQPQVRTDGGAGETMPIADFPGEPESGQGGDFAQALQPAHNRRPLRIPCCQWPFCLVLSLFA